MFVLVSPYHLTSREPPAMSCLLLATQVITLMPAPLSGQTLADVRRAAADSPLYLRFMQSWEWAMPLFTAGVAASTFAGEDPGADARRAHALLRDDPRFDAMRSVLRPDLYELERDYLDLVASDILKGGPDPGVLVPLAAGIDRFAARFSLAVARSQPVSVAQRAEMRLGARCFAIALPYLVRASAARLLLARDLLDEPLAHLRRVIASASEADPTELNAELRDAAAGYACAFADHRQELLATDPETRAVEGTLALTGLLLPADAVLRSAISAVRIMSVPVAEPAASTTLPALFDELSSQRVLSLICKQMGRKR